jgi:hypothetical protein
MVILAGCLGLGRSEFTGLKWSDFNWRNATLTISCGIAMATQRKADQAWVSCSPWYSPDRLIA